MLKVFKTIKQIELRPFAAAVIKYQNRNQYGFQLIAKLLNFTNLTGPAHLSIERIAISRMIRHSVSRHYMLLG